MRSTVNTPVPVFSVATLRPLRSLITTSLITMSYLSSACALSGTVIGILASIPELPFMGLFSSDIITTVYLLPLTLLSLIVCPLVRVSDRVAAFAGLANGSCMLNCTATTSVLLVIYTGTLATLPAAAVSSPTVSALCAAAIRQSTEHSNAIAVLLNIYAVFIVCYWV